MSELRVYEEDIFRAGQVVPLSPILVTIPDAAAMIGRGATFIYAAISNGVIQAVKSDKRTLVVVKSLQDYVASLPPPKMRPVPKRDPLPVRQGRQARRK